jgi:hypothetical protein
VDWAARAMGARRGTEAVSEAMAEPETAAGFLMDRRPWLHVVAIDRGEGWFDVAVTVDGTYSGDVFDPVEVVAFFDRWLAEIIETEEGRSGAAPREVGGHR